MSRTPNLATDPIVPELLRTRLEAIGQEAGAAVEQTAISPIVTESKDYSVTIMDTNGRIQGYRKADLEDLRNDDTSLMPDFGLDRLPDPDLKSLIAFLGTLRAEARTGAE